MTDHRTVRSLVALAGAAVLSCGVSAQPVEGLQRSPAMTMQERPESAPVGGSDQITPVDAPIEGEAGAEAEGGQSAGGSAGGGVTFDAAMRYRAKRIATSDARVSIPGSPIRRFRSEMRPTRPADAKAAPVEHGSTPSLGRWIVQDGRLVYRTPSRPERATKPAVPEVRREAPDRSSVQRRPVLRDVGPGASQATARYRQFTLTGRVERPGTNAADVKRSIRRALTEKAGDSLARAHANRQGDGITRRADEQ